jgi:glycerate-2-kinase
MKKLLLCIALVTGGGLALASSCPKEMKAIDDKLAMSPKLADADMAKVKMLRAEGEAAHKAGKHDDSIKALNEAKKMLGI